MGQTDTKPLSMSEYLMGTGLLLTLYLIYSVIVLLSGYSPVPDAGPRPRVTLDNLTSSNTAARMTEFEVRDKESGQAAFLFFLSFLGPILLWVGYSIREQTPPSMPNIPSALAAQLQKLTGQEQTPEQFLQQMELQEEPETPQPPFGTHPS